MSKSKGIPILGVILVIAGAILLLNAVDLIHLHWSYFLIAAGAALFAVAFKSKDKGGVFPGAIVLLIGLLFLLRYHYILDDSMRYMWPVFPAIVGIAFFVLFIFKSSDWGLLIPGAICLFVGVYGLAYNYWLVRQSPWEIIARYWPLILIVVGAHLILKDRRRPSDKISDEEVKPPPE